MNKLIILLTLFLTSCASIVSDNVYPVQISTIPQGKVVTLKDSDGKKIRMARTPYTAHLDSGEGYFDGAEYTLECEGQSQTLHSNFDEWYVGNLLFGGFIGMLIVDPINGSMWELPIEVVIDMSGTN